MKRHPMKAQLVSIDEAIEAKGQHTKPCADCPWGRTALRGWLGGSTTGEWLATAHGDGRIECHTCNGAQCAGAAIYRTNVCKRVDPPNLALPVDRVRVFGSPFEFAEHHDQRKYSLPEIQRMFLTARFK